MVGEKLLFHFLLIQEGHGDNYYFYLFLLLGDLHV